MDRSWWRDIKNRDKPIIVISDILPNSIIDNINVLNRYDILTKVNNKKVSSMKSLKTALSKPIIKNEKKFLKFVCESDGEIVINLKNVLDQEVGNSNIYEYNIDKTILKLYSK